MSVFRLPLCRNVVVTAIKQANVLSVRYNSHFRSGIDMMQPSEYDDALRKWQQQQHDEVDEQQYPIGLQHMLDMILVSTSRGLHSSQSLETSRTTFTPYDYDEHDVEMSLLKEQPIATAGIPLAIKRGQPFQHNEIPPDFDPKEDIWIIRKPSSYNWEPPKTDDGLQESQLYQTYGCLLDYLINKSSLLHLGHNDNIFLRSNDGIRFTGREADDIIVASGLKDQLSDERSKSLLKFSKKLLNAVKTDWSNDEGKSAMLVFMEAAIEVCDKHAFTLKKTCPFVEASKLGGDGNCQYAMKRVNPEVIKEKGREDALRGPKMWTEPNNQTEIHNPPPDTTNYWAYSYRIPDAYISVECSSSNDNPNDLVGLVTGEVKTGRIKPVDERQAFVQALKGLSHGPLTASLIMAPHEAIFQSIKVDEGFVNTEKKRYSGYSQYKTLFSDLVLYLWNAYYIDQSQ